MFPWKLMVLLETVDNVREIKMEKKKSLIKKLGGSIRNIQRINKRNRKTNSQGDGIAGQ